MVMLKVMGWSILVLFVSVTAWCPPDPLIYLANVETDAGSDAFTTLQPVPVGKETHGKWYRGNLHTHSFWSDGNDFPEMIVKWYADHGYHFLALTDHNILSRGEKWMSLDTVEKRAGGTSCMTKYQEAFGSDWIQTRDTSDAKQVLLCSLDRIKKRFEKEDEFLLIEAEEISDSVNGKPVHMNATNLESLLRPTGGATVREAIDSNLRAAAEQAAKTGRQILVHLNHPNFGWAVTAEDLAAVTRNRFFEVYNGHPGVNHNGDARRPSIERMWDIINTLRLDKFNVLPLYGLAVDDSHNYHGKPGGSNPGRGWVCVHAESLAEEDLIRAMYDGDFYSSSGVELVNVEFNPNTRTLELEIAAQEGATYETKFIGTRRGYDESSEPRKNTDGSDLPSTRIYSKDIGEVFKTSDSLRPSYQMQGDEIFVRAVITSTADHSDPSFKGQKKQAWTQPVGWQK